jgi:hypothetical protein
MPSAHTHCSASTQHSGRMQSNAEDQTAEPDNAAAEALG